MSATASHRTLSGSTDGSNDIGSELDPTCTVIILVDLINWQAAPDSAVVKSIRASAGDEPADYLVSRCANVILPNLQRLLPVARKAGIRILHARFASRHPDYLDIVPALRSLARSGSAQDGTPACEPLAEVGYQPGDLSIVKPGSGAFTGSHLDFLLRRLGIDTIFYAGVVTNACVLLSAASGFDLGYRQFLITDCTGAMSDEDQAYAERFICSYVAKRVTTEQASAEFEELVNKAITR